MKEPWVLCKGCDKPLQHTLAMQRRHVQPACPHCDPPGYRMQVDGGLARAEDEIPLTFLDEPPQEHYVDGVRVIDGVAVG
jgi:hypothetical protein